MKEVLDMITLMSTNGQVQYDHDEWVVDKEEDLKLLPRKHQV